MQNQLDHAINDFLARTSRWTPRWFNKPKFHVILHLAAHIRRFGPAILFATEAFESFNAVIRAKSVHSNRQAPSRDIALAFAQGNRVRHFLSGGRVLVRTIQQDQPILGPQNLLPHAEALHSAAASRPSILRMPSTSSTSVLTTKMVQLPELVDAGEAGLWQTVGEGPLGLVQKPNTVTQYLGLNKHKDYSKYGTRCSYFE